MKMISYPLAGEDAGHGTVHPAVLFLLLLAGLLFIAMGFKVEGLVAFTLFLVCAPEIAFALFTFAGVFKADPRIPPLPFDLTLAFAGLTLAGVALRSMPRGSAAFMHTLKKSRSLLFGYLALTAVMLLGLVYTPSPTYGYDKVFRFVTVTAFGCFAPLILFDSQRRLNLFFCAIIVLACVSTIDSLITQPVTEEEWHLGSAFGSNYLALGRLTAFAIISTMGLAFSLRGNVKKLFLIAPVLCLNLYGLFSAGARGPVVAFGAALLLVWLFELPLARAKTKLVLGVTSIMVSVVLFLSLFHSHFQTLFMRLGDISSAFAGRTAFLTISVDAFLSSPSAWLFGVGTGGFHRMAGHADELIDQTAIYPHNIFAEFASENGILGLCALLALLLPVAGRLAALLRDRGKTNSWVPWIYGLLVFMFINTLFSGDVNDNRLFFTCFGILYAADSIYRQRNP